MYQGIKIPKNIILVVKKDKRAYVVDEGNTKMLESARVWARDYNYYTKKEYPFEELTYENGTFRLELQDSAYGSSVGGKLSFWNCKLVASDGREFIIGINSELLLDILKSETFKKGVCQSVVYLGRVKGNQVGVFTKSMKSFQQAIEDEKSRNDIKTKTTVKYEVGDEVKTLTKTQVYLGTLYKMYNDSHYYSYYPAGVSLFNEPIKVHVFGEIEDDKVYYRYFTDTYEKKPKRLLTGKKYNVTLEKLYNNAWKEIEKEYDSCAADRKYYKCRSKMWFLQYTLDGDVVKTRRQINDIYAELKSDYNKI